MPQNPTGSRGDLLIVICPICARILSQIGCSQDANDVFSRAMDEVYVASAEATEKYEYRNQCLVMNLQVHVYEVVKKSRALLEENVRCFRHSN